MRYILALLTRRCWNVPFRLAALKIRKKTMTTGFSCFSPALVSVPPWRAICMRQPLDVLESNGTTNCVTKVKAVYIYRCLPRPLCANGHVQRCHLFIGRSFNQPIRNCVTSARRRRFVGCLNRFWSFISGSSESGRHFFALRLVIL